MSRNGIEGLRLLRFLALVCAGAGYASDGPRKIFPLAYDQHDYSNGLRLISIPTDYPNIVALFIVVQTGSRNEVEAGRSGFAHLFEHMLFRGTKEYPPERYQDALKQAGAASNAFTSDDITAYHTTCSKEDLETMLRMEADRFQNLEYSPAGFKTEALAVLGEYNKNNSNPISRLNEALREAAFDRHTYQHTTMGFLRDIENMPELYEYSRLFFDRYYRPEYTTIIVAGDISSAATVRLVEKYWSRWKRGSYRAAIPAEPKQEASRTARVEWPSPTLPLVTVAFKTPAFSVTSKDGPALHLLSEIGFGETSELYRRLVIQQQRVDWLFGSRLDRVDPCLFTVVARVKQPQDVDAIRDEILAAFDGLKTAPASPERMDAVKRNVRYAFALSLDSSEAIARMAARYVGLTRSPESVNRFYALLDQVTPEDLQSTARTYFVESGRTIAILAEKAR